MSAPRPGLRLRAAWAAILSLIVPGLGHIYARTWRLGIVLAVINEALSITARVLASRMAPTNAGITTVVLVILLSLFLMMGAATDAVRRLLKTPPNTILAAPQRRSRWWHPTWFAAIVLIALGVGVDAGIPIRWQAITVSSASMVPSLMVRDKLVADLRSRQRIQRGDVILFAHRAAPTPDAGTPVDAVYIKRIIGMPGDRIAIRDGRVVLNGTPLPWRDDGDFNIPQDMAFDIRAHRWTETLPNNISYQVVTIPPSPGTPSDTRKAPRTLPEITIPPGQIFVLGDNRDNSFDSRFPSFGTVPIIGVIGRPRTIYWSPDRTRIMTPIP